IDRLVINGNRNGLLGLRGSGGGPAWSSDLCAAHQMRNLLIQAPYVTLQRSVVKNALCDAGIHVLGVHGVKSPGDRAPFIAPAETHHLTIVQNRIVANGASQFGTPFYFSDGLVVFDADDTVIAFNRIVDNTDVQLILGGCRRCEIHDNELGHTDLSYG